MRNSWAVKQYTGKGLSDILYLEWKYFNVGSEDFNAIISYSVGDPRNISKHGACIIYVTVFIESKEFTKIIEVPLPSCMLSEKDCSLNAGKYGIKREEEGIHIYGETESISWDLLFHGEERAIEHKYAFKSMYPIREWMDWTIFIPRSKVSGTLNIQGKEIAVNALGYHDGNRGKWVHFARMWEGFFYISKSDDVVISLVKFHGQEGASLHIFWEGGHFFLSHRDFDINVLEKNEIGSPKTMEITGKNSSGSVNIRLKTIKKSELLVEMPFFIPSFSVEEFLVIADIKLSLNRFVYEKEGKRAIYERTVRDRR